MRRVEQSHRTARVLCLGSDPQTQRIARGREFLKSTCTATASLATNQRDP